jgi:hypothetical protein
MRKPRKVNNTPNQVAASLMGDFGLSDKEREWVRKVGKREKASMFGKGKLSSDQTAILHARLVRLFKARWNRRATLEQIEKALLQIRLKEGTVKKAYPVDAGPVMKPIIEGLADEWETSQKGVLEMAIRLLAEAGLLPPHLNPG